jgi:hypothetical protein
MKDLTYPDTDRLPLPMGFTIGRTERSDDHVVFDIFEDGVVWPETGTPRSILDVDVTNWERYGGRANPEVSWPSTSDQRPELALALAAALTLAAEEADRFAAANAAADKR